MFPYNEFYNARDLRKVNGFGECLTGALYAILDSAFKEFPQYARENGYHVLMPVTSQRSMVMGKQFDYMPITITAYNYDGNLRDRKTLKEFPGKIQFISSNPNPENIKKVFGMHVRENHERILKRTLENISVMKQNGKILHPDLIEFLKK